MTAQRIAITGSSGLIGGALSSCLRRRGDSVVRLVRRHPVGPDEVRLPERDSSDADLVAALHGVDAVVNLAGAGVGDHRWTPAYKETLRRSRLETTATVTAALERVERPVRFVSGSATGFYGNRGETVLDEASTPGDDFLARLCVDWEAAAGVPPRHPVAMARTGLVMTGQGGAFAPLLRATRLGVGGPLGSGRQWWSWISLRDEVRALMFLIDHPEITGPVNLVAPRASRQRELAQAVARSTMRPSIVPAPAIALRALLGEMSAQVTASTRVRPGVLDAAGFEWLDANQDQAIDRLAAGRL